MPVGNVWNVEWLNQNALRNYPLSETATLTDISGNFNLPNDLIVDFILTVNPDNVDIEKFHISSVGIYGDGITIGVGYNGEEFATVGFSVSNFTRNSVYTISGTGDFSDAIGRITVGSIDNALASAGLWTFDLAGGRLESSVIHTDVRGVSSITVSTRGDVSSPLRGDILIQAGNNMRLSAYTEDDYTVIRFDAVAAGTDLTPKCPCEEADVSNPIRTINGIGPDANGNFVLSGNDCIEISPDSHGVILRDTCSKPCCGCEELNVLANDIKRVRDLVYTLVNATAKLRQQTANLESNIMASRVKYVGGSSKSAYWFNYYPEDT